MEAINKSFTEIDLHRSAKLFKSTDVGEIPVDWNVVEAADIGTFKGGSGFPLVYQGREHGDYPFFKVSDLSHRENLASLKRANHYISESTRRKLGAYLFPKNTIVFAKVGAAIFLERKRMLDQQSCIDNNMAGLVVSEADADTRFIYHFLTQFRLGSLVSTTALPSLNGRVLKSIVLPLPPKAEQTIIANALDDADANIRVLEIAVEKKRLIKQGAMQDLLSGRRRLPGFTGDWTAQQLGALLLRQPAYGINASAVPYDTRYPAYIRITDISNDGRFNPAARTSVIHPAAESYRLEPGDLVLARTGASTGKSYLYREQDGELVFAGFLIRISPDPVKLSSRYLKLQLETATYWEWIRTNSMRSGQPGVNGRQYASMPIALPPTRAEQDTIADALTDMDTEIEALELRLQKARQIKQGMMQQLLTGRVRLV